MCDVDADAVTAAVDAPSIYDIPKVLHREGLDAYVIRRLGLGFRDVDWTAWDQLLDRVHDPEHEVEVALVGKYIDLPDAYLSVTEALRAGGFHHDAKVTDPLGRLRRLPDRGRARSKALGGVDAIVVPGGLRGPRDRGQGRGAALGARAPGAHPRPLSRPAVHGHRVRPQRRRDRGGQLDRVRPADPRPGHRDDGGAEGLRRGRRRPRWDDAARRLPGDPRPRRRSSPRPTAPPRCSERHRHRYEVNNAYRDAARATPGSSSAAPRRTAHLVEFVELPADVHPYYVSTQAHPEFKSRPTRAHPLFAGLVGAAIAAQRASRLVEVERPRRSTVHMEPATTPRAASRPRPDAVADAPLTDRVEPRHPTSSRVVFAGRVWDVVEETFELGEAGRADPRVHRPPGRRRRPRPRRGRPRPAHPAVPPPGRGLEWELPAGLLDVDGEPPPSPPPASWPRRPTAPPGGGTPSSTTSPRRAARPRRCASSSPATSPSSRRRSVTSEPARSWVCRSAGPRWRRSVDAILTDAVHNPSLLIGVLTALAAREPAAGVTCARPTPRGRATPGRAPYRPDGLASPPRGPAPHAIGRRAPCRATRGTQGCRVGRVKDGSMNDTTHCPRAPTTSASFPATATRATTRRRAVSRAGSTRPRWNGSRSSSSCSSTGSSASG